MKEFKEKDIIKAKVTGIQEYGAFVNIDNEHDGLIHISEISYGYVKNINDYVKIGDKISIKLGNREIKIEVTSINEYVKKEDASSMYKILSQ